jgi:hypothetical protein
MGSMDCLTISIVMNENVRLSWKNVASNSHSISLLLSLLELMGFLES